MPRRTPPLMSLLVLAACATPGARSAETGASRVATRDAASGALVGETLEGQRVDLGGPGPVRLVELWATWCAPCAPATEIARPVLRRHPAVVAWSLALDERAAVARHVASNAVLGSVLLYPGGLAAATRRGLSQVPTFVAIGRDGHVAGTVVGLRPGLAAALDRLLDRAEASGARLD